jgi:phosphatidylglycerophosphate synthase
MAHRTTAMNPAAATAPAPDQALRLDAARALAGAALALLAVAATVGWWAGLGADYTLKALLVYALGAALVWRGLALGGHPHARFGAANRVTLGRLGGMALVAALLGEAVPAAPPAAQPVGGWALIVFATAVAVLYAADGALARRQGLASRFGARFDMETDAAFMLVLCALVWQAGQAGAWVLASGLMRYAFVAAAAFLPWLAGPLPPSVRRQAVCVVQITALIVCLGPIVPAPLASAIAALSLLLLATSFAIDIRYLQRHLARQRHPQWENRA